MNYRMVALFLLLFPVTAAAQISLSGVYDFEIKKGGGDSKADVNKLSNGFVQFNVHSFQLFLDAPVAEHISVSAKIASTKRGGTDAIGVNVELASVTFSNLIDGALNVSAGKILTPFGSFTRRQLSPDNPHIGVPLFFYYGTNVSSTSGYMDSAGVLFAQSIYGGKLSTIYYGGYYSGVEVFGSLADDMFFYDLALMNAPLSSLNPGLNLDKQPAFHGRLAFHPAIWGTFGASYSRGSFLERGSINSFLEASGTAEDYKQMTTGFDLNLNYLYYELNAEYIVNTFGAPYGIYDFTIPPPSPPYRSGLTGSKELSLKSSEVLVDFKVDAPFYPGLYIAGRYNAVTYGSIVDPYVNGSTFGKSIPWDHGVQRFEVTLGYKPARGVVIKAGYQRTIVDVKPRPDIDVIGSQISVSF